MKEEQAEGIVLKSIDYKEQERIITLFTPDSGVISLIVKSVADRKRLALSSPFCRGEYIFTRGKSDLFRLRDGTTLNDHFDLRKEYQYIQAAGTMTSLILHSQLPGKAAPALYALFSTCLDQLPSFSYPLTLVTAFRLKLFTHEGLISWETRVLDQALVIQNSCCEGPAESFTPIEWEAAKELATCRSFSHLRSLRLSEEFAKKVEESLRKVGLEPTRVSSLPPQSSASANSATFAKEWIK
jgi:hypothetical protein